MPILDLPAGHLRVVRELLAKHAPDMEVWAYGSRLNGTAHEGSDLDLVIRNPANPSLPQNRLHVLRDALIESDLPILIDVLDWARIPDAFRSEIERTHVVVHEPVHGDGQTTKPSRTK